VPSVRFSSYAGMDIGRDNGLPVSRSYVEQSLFPLTGALKKAVFDVHPHSPRRTGTTSSTRKCTRDSSPTGSAGRVAMGGTLAPGSLCCQRPQRRVDRGAR
jgi:hypothetical protein